MKEILHPTKKGEKEEGSLSLILLVSLLAWNKKEKKKKKRIERKKREYTYV